MLPLYIRKVLFVMQCVHFIIYTISLDVWELCTGQAVPTAAPQTLKLKPNTLSLLLVIAFEIIFFLGGGKSPNYICLSRLKHFCLRCFRNYKFLGNFSMSTFHRPLRTMIK